MLDFMESDRARLSDLETQILDLECSLSALRTEQARVRDRLNDYKYPVLELPNEITSEIFVRFIPVYPVAPPLIGIDSPTTLTHVCRQWRDVALATPMLWSAIKFDDNVYEWTAMRWVFADWMKRSQSCGLSISITVNYDDDKFLKEILVDPSTVRWEHLQLEGYADSFLEIRSSLPMLHSLDLDLDGISTHEFTFHAALPRLRTAVLYARSIPARVALGPIDLPHFERGHDERIGPKLDGVKVDLPFLESLDLRDDAFMEQAATVAFLDSFVAPALSRLDVEEIFLREDPIARLQLLISKSGCRLQEVCIRGLTTTVRDRFGQAFPSIPTFSFPDAYEEESDEDEYEGEDDSD
ncbi:F-box domain-containing protein [Mycena sanguinolenta]|uniref:F-box domain-containing protein n=1 Tax=Mycena sanguinolenta TaxID=230812 RepID=A0A8H7DJV3_9AGAR|nr:F-box domain-containing protein [Mycena sanguinolenta]